MPKAVFNGKVIAESDATEQVEGNHYFPPDAVRAEYLQESDKSTHCPWKGDASYRHVVVDGETAENAAWFYPSTKPEAKHFEGYYAFWNGVKIEL